MNADRWRRTCLGLALAAWLPARAQAPAGAPPPPQGAWRLVLPYPAGGAPDTFARLLAAALAARWAVPVLVENRPGASGLLAARQVARSRADGRMLLLMSSGLVTLAALDPGFDLLAELRPVARLSVSPLVVVTRADSPHRTLQGLVAAARATPGQLSMGTAGLASPAHRVLGQLDGLPARFPVLAVPYKGAVESALAVLSGQVDGAVLVLGTALPHLRDGRMQALAVTSERRVPLLPQVPTVAEALGAGFVEESWAGLAMRSDATVAEVAQVSAALQAAVQSPELTRYMREAGSLAADPATPARFAEQLRAEVQAERAAVTRLRIRLE